MRYVPDKKLYNMINEVTEKLEDLLDKKIECKYLFDADISNKVDFTFYIYDKEGYKEVYVEQIENLPTNKNYYIENYYVSVVLEALNNGTYDEVETTTEERFISDKLKENECENIYIIDNRLYQEGNEDSIYIPSIYAICYNADEGVFLIGTDADENIYQVDLVKETINLISDEELKAIINK